MPGKPVRIGAGAPFGVGDKIHLPVGLLERLRDVERAEPCPPGHHLLDRAADRVPERLRAVDRDRLAADVEHAVARPYGGDPVVCVVHVPDQPAAERADQRMLRVALPPDLGGPTPIIEPQALQTLRLDG